MFALYPIWVYNVYQGLGNVPDQNWRNKMAAYNTYRIPASELTDNQIEIICNFNVKCGSRASKKDYKEVVVSFHEERAFHVYFIENTIVKVVKNEVEFSIKKAGSKLLRKALESKGCKLVGSGKKCLNFKTSNYDLIPNDARIQIVTEHWIKRLTNFANGIGGYCINDNGEKVLLPLPRLSFISGKQFKSFVV